jgi:hypothetical protein
MKTFLHVALLHHVENATASAAADTLRRVFGPDRGLGRPGGGPIPGGVWDSVGVTVMSSKEHVAAFQPAPSDRVLWILMVDYPMTIGPDWPVILQEVAQRLEADDGDPAELRFQVLAFGSDEVVKRLPEKLRDFQALENSALGEIGLRPHVLALLALHRARRLLGRSPEKNALKLFISHAKADGIFFADALRTAIERVKELQGWYDADDITSGSKWRDMLRTSASNNVFIALRTEAYSESLYCREEFECALEYGVPIVVVDALMYPEISPAALPFAAMPTVRIPDGNTHRVLIAALREHLRVLLVETQITEESAELPVLAAWSVWPRLPAYQVIQSILFHATNAGTRCLVIAEAPGVEFMAACALLDKLGMPLRLTTPDRFSDLAAVLALQPAPATPPSTAT